MFINNVEALKQVIERVNGVLKNNLIVETKNLNNSNYLEQAPSTISRLYDTSVDSLCRIRIYWCCKK